MASSNSSLGHSENNPHIPEWVDAQVILQLLKVSKPTLKRYRAKNIVVHSKMGGKYLYDIRYILNQLDDEKEGGKKLG